MKTQFWALFLVCGLLAFPFQRGEAAGSDHARYVQVTGEGETHVEPDRAVLNFGIETTGKELKPVQVEAAQKSDKLMSVLKRLKIDAKDIQTTAVNIQPQYQFDQGKRKFIGYSAQKNFTVLLRDLSSYGAVIDGVLTAGVENVSGLQFQSSKAEEAQAEARAKAVRDAKKKAEQIAGHLEQKLGKAISVEEQTAAPPMPFHRGMMMSQKGLGEESGDALALGQIPVRASVTVRFELQ